MTLLLAFFCSQFLFVNPGNIVILVHPSNLNDNAEKFDAHFAIQYSQRLSPVSPSVSVHKCLQAHAHQPALFYFSQQSAAWLEIIESLKSAILFALVAKNITERRLSMYDWIDVDKLMDPTISDETLGYKTAPEWRSRVVNDDEIDDMYYEYTLAFLDEHSPQAAATMATATVVA